MKTLMKRLWNEPALFLGFLNAGVQAVQLLALELPTAVSVAIALLGAFGQGLLTRAEVIPVAKLNRGRDVVAVDEPDDHGPA